MVFQTLGVLNMSVSDPLMLGYIEPLVPRSEDAEDEVGLGCVSSHRAHLYLIVSDTHLDETGFIPVGDAHYIKNQFQLNIHLKNALEGYTPEKRNQIIALRRRLWHWRFILLKFLQDFGMEMRGEHVPCYLCFEMGPIRE